MQDGFCSIKSDANQNMMDIAPINWILDITRKKFLQKIGCKTENDEYCFNKPDERPGKVQI